MDIFQNVIAVFIVFVAVFCVLKVSFSRKEGDGCSCGNNCSGCKETKTVKILDSRDSIKK